MPVRKIPRFGAQKNIGKFSSVKTGRVAWFESLLERDYMYLLDYELAISYWVEQPLKIRFGDNGRTCSYTPDFEVHRQSKKQIIEVKTKKQVDSGTGTLYSVLQHSSVSKKVMNFLWSRMNSFANNHGSTTLRTCGSTREHQSEPGIKFSALSSFERNKLQR